MAWRIHGMAHPWLAHPQAELLEDIANPSNWIRDASRHSATWQRWTSASLKGPSPPWGPNKK